MLFYREYKLQSSLAKIIFRIDKEIHMRIGTYTPLGTETRHIQKRDIYYEIFIQASSHTQINILTMHASKVYSIVKNTNYKAAGRR